jgi:hypothetical protein
MAFTSMLAMGYRAALLRERRHALSCRMENRTQVHAQFKLGRYRTFFLLDHFDQLAYKSRHNGSIRPAPKKRPGFLLGGVFQFRFRTKSMACFASARIHLLKAKCSL